MTTMAFYGDTAGTVNINVSGASQSVQLFPERGPISVLVTNDGSATAWISYGDSTVAASLTTSIPIKAGASQLLTMHNNGNGPLFVAAIAAAATGKIYFTPGRGNTH